MVDWGRGNSSVQGRLKSVVLRGVADRDGCVILMRLRARGVGGIGGCGGTGGIGLILDRRNASLCKGISLVNILVFS